MPHPRVTAHSSPNKPAIIMGISGETVTYQQLEERSNQGAHLFRSLGLRAGDHIGIMMENNRQYLEIVWAAQRSGLIFTPISTHLTRDETVYILGNCEARLFIGSWEFADIGEEVLCEPCQVDHFYMVGGTRAGFQSWEDACAQQPVTPLDDESNGVPMLYSSGTTGMPKGVFVEPVDDNVNTPPVLAPYLAATFGFNEESIYLSPAPLYHAAPLHYCMMTTFQGGTLIVMEKFEAERALKLIERYRVSHSQWVPIMFIRMLKLPTALRESYDITSMKVAIHAAAPCPIEIKEKMINWWGEIVFEYYSSSEGIGVTMINSTDWLTHKGSVGLPVVGELHIVDSDGSELPPGENGVIYFSGDHIRFSYHDEPKKTTEVYHERGWATARDIGYVDKDGFLFLTDRENFTMISGGVKIYPQELENILATHEKVADVAVFGVPNEEFGEVVKAVIEPVTWSEANHATSNEILQWLSGRVSKFKMPRTLDFHPNLPRLDNGKLYKRQLVEEYRNDSP
jgi:long-chain acyl-CoA synthetase